MDNLSEPKLPVREPQVARSIDAGKVQASCSPSSDKPVPQPVNEDPLGFSMCGMAG